MKKSFLILLALAIAWTAYGQTVENIRAVPDGENIKITYRIGASTDAQLFNIFLSCSMSGGRRFEPKAVIGDVGENIVGGRSFYTIIWDVFEDVNEVVNPEFFIRLELVRDMSVPPVQPQTQVQGKPQEETREVKQEPVREEPKETVKQEPQKTDETAKAKEKPSEPTAVLEESREGKNFRRNGFVAYNGSPFRGYPDHSMPIGISFGSLNNWGYYVTFRLGLHLNSYEQYDPYWGDYDWIYENNFDFITMAGFTKHIVSAGFYRLHAYGGLGANVNSYWVNDNDARAHVLVDTGVINVLGMFNITVGVSYFIDWFNYNSGLDPLKLVFGAGFVF